MKKLFAITCMVILFFTATLAFQAFNRADFFKAMSSGKMDDVNTELAVLEKSGDTYNAYAGALLMRKAGLASIPKTKLKYFKEGRKKFQQGFDADSNNTELRFLRLAIQENAPKIVKYRSNINADKVFIKTHFKTLSPVVQKAVLEYSKNSKVLRPEDF